MTVLSFEAMNLSHDTAVQVMSKVSSDHNHLFEVMCAFFYDVFEVVCITSKMAQSKSNVQINRGGGGWRKNSRIFFVTPPPPPRVPPENGVPGCGQPPQIGTTSGITERLSSFR